MEINRSLNLNPKLARGVRSTSIDRSHGSPTRKGVTATRKHPLAPSFQQIEVSGDGGGGCKRAPAGDSLNDEQRRDHLPNPSSDWTTRPNIEVMGEHEPGSERG